MSINTIGNAENDRIAFITLHGFEIFDEERLFPIILEEVFLFRCALPPLGKQFINQVLLRYAERNHTKTAVRIFLNILIDQINNKLCFLPAYLVINNLTHSTLQAAFFSILAVAFLSHILARIMKAPVTVFLIAGILPSVPGAGIYRTVYYLIQGDQALSTHYLISTLHTAGAIALAIFITDSVVNLVHLYHEGSHARRN